MNQPLNPAVPKASGKSSLNEFLTQNDKILDEFLKVNSMWKMNNEEGIEGTSIPFVYNLIGSWLINPSTVSLDTFQRMAYSDPVITSALEYNSSVISNTIGEYHHPDSKIQEFVRDCFKRLKGGKDQLIRDIMTCMWSGFFCGEKVYSSYSEFIDGKLWIKEVLPLPAMSLIFRVDNAGRLENFIYQYVYYAGAPGIQNILSSNYGGGSLEGDIEFLGNRCATNSPDALSYEGDFTIPIRSTNIQMIGLQPIPRGKIIHYARKGQDGLNNPYGRSMLRAAYNFYILKCAMLQFLAVASKIKSFPLLLAYVDPNALSAPTSVTPEFPNAMQQPYQVNAQQAVDTVADILSQSRGDNAIVLPWMKNIGCLVDTVHCEGNTDLLINTMNFLDDQLQKSLFFPSSMLGGGAGASYAMGTSQNSIHSKLLSADRNAIAGTLVTEFVKDIIVKNFPEEQHKNFFGWFDAELLNTEDKINVLKLYELMVSTGLSTNFIKEDVDRFRQKIGEPPLSNEEFELLKEHAVTASNKNDNSNKTDAKEIDKHYKHQTDVPVGGST